MDLRLSFSCDDMKFSKVILDSFRTLSADNMTLRCGRVPYLENVQKRNSLSTKINIVL